MKNIQIVDIFSGIGGFSQGAKDAGCDVILAVDHWSEALEAHELNHPNTHHLNIECGSDESIEFIINTVNEIRNHDLPLHLHCSPPCQQLTYANKRNHDTEAGLRLVLWSILLKERLLPDSFSMEQVNHKELQLYLKSKNLHFEFVRMC